MVLSVEQGPCLIKSKTESDAEEMLVAEACNDVHQKKKEFQSPSPADDAVDVKGEKHPHMYLKSGLGALL